MVATNRVAMRLRDALAAPLERAAPRRSDRRERDHVLRRVLRAREDGREGHTLTDLSRQDRVVAPRSGTVDRVHEQPRCRSS